MSDSGISNATIATEFGISDAAVSKKLKKMRQMGDVEVSPFAKARYPGMEQELYEWILCMNMKFKETKVGLSLNMIKHKVVCFSCYQQQLTLQR